MLTYRNGHIFGHFVPFKLVKANLHNLSDFSGKVLLKHCLVRYKTYSMRKIKAEQIHYVLGGGI